MVRVLLVLSVFLVLCGCAQTSAPIEKKGKQEGVQQDGRRAGVKQADPQSTGQRSERVEKKGAQRPKVVVKRETQPAKEIEKRQTREAPEQKSRYTGRPSNTANHNEGQGGSRHAVTVVRAVDGDTIDITPRVDGRQRVRLIGVDTPEVGQPYAQEAGAFTRERLQGLQVTLEFDVERIDPYNRLLAYVYLPDCTMFNEALVRAGYAQVATFPPNVKHAGRFLASQRQARAAGRGLWGLPEGKQCDLTNRGNGIGESSESCTAPAWPTPPPSNRKGVPTISQTACPKNAPIKGNAQSGIYHTRVSATYDETYPEECFASEAAARAAGYRAARD